MRLFDLIGRNPKPSDDESGLLDELDETPAADDELGKPEGYPESPDGSQDPEGTQ